MPTFKVKRQIYHKAGSLLPFPESQHKFLQMHFIRDGNDELNARREISTGIKRSIVSQLQEILHEKDNLVRLFITINQPTLCNGTRLAVKILLSNVVEATILTGPFKGEDDLIPRISMIPTDVPFQYKGLQFPI